ncbi:MAG: hypothetical protein VW802_05240 [Rhodospirillaceae bacterium]
MTFRPRGWTALVGVGVGSEVIKRSLLIVSILSVFSRPVLNLPAFDGLKPARRF